MINMYFCQNFFFFDYIQLVRKMIRAVNNGLLPLLRLRFTQRVIYFDFDLHDVPLVTNGFLEISYGNIAYVYSTLW